MAVSKQSGPLTKTSCSPPLKKKSTFTLQSIYPDSETQKIKLDTLSYAKSSCDSIYPLNLTFCALSRELGAFRYKVMLASPPFRKNQPVLFHRFTQIVKHKKNKLDTLSYDKSSCDSIYPLNFTFCALPRELGGFRYKVMPASPSFRKKTPKNMWSLPILRYTRVGEHAFCELAPLLYAKSPHVSEYQLFMTQLQVSWEIWLFQNRVVPYQKHHVAPPSQKKIYLYSPIDLPR